MRCTSTEYNHNEYIQTKSLNMKHLRLILCAFLLICVSTLSSCGPSRAELQTQARLAISKDVVNITNTCFEQATLGIGGFLADMIISKNQKDSLILQPINPFIDQELSNKSEEDLKKIIESKKERMKLILSLVTNNREAILSYANEKIKFAKELFEVITPYIEKMLAQQNKS